jgi:glycosyltransferase involved in cell wall biosynthesis
VPRNTCSASFSSAVARRTERGSSVAYVVSTWPSLSQTFVLNEIVALEKRGMRLRIFSVKDPRSEPVHEKVSGVAAGVTYLSLGNHWKAVMRANIRVACKKPLRYIQTLSRALRYRRMGVLRGFLRAGYVAQQVLENPVEHLHAHFATAPALVAMFASELSGTSYSFTAHARDIYVDTRPELLRAQMERAKAVVTICEYNRRYLRQISPLTHGKVHCIYNGLDMADFNFRWPRAFDAGRPLILCVARLVEKKGLQNLIEAAASLRQRGLDFQVEIIGDGPLRTALEGLATQLGLSGCVKLVGPQPIETVRLAYHRAAIFALPCLVSCDGDRDGIPTVLLEAMLSGLPVVSTFVAGIPELVDSPEVGVIVESGDSGLLAMALESLLVDPHRRDRIARCARTRAETHFSIEASCERLSALFNGGGQR